MIFSYLALKSKELNIAKKARTTCERGTKHAGLIKVVKQRGFHSFVYKNSNIRQVKSFINKKLLVIAHYIEPSEDISHYAVVVSYTKNKLILNDPYNWEGFKIDNKNF